MIRRYCDICGAEMTAKNTPKGGINGGRVGAEIEMRRGGQRLKVEVIHSHNDVSNAGDVCTHCILDALYLLDDRPKPAHDKPFVTAR